jgi:hypothetical protein
MVREPTSAAARRRVDDVDLPEGAAHIIVVANTLNAPAPAGYPGADRLVYEPGDELPFERGKRAFRGHAPMLAVLDAAGEHLAGGGPHYGNRVGLRSVEARRERQEEQLQRAIERWRRGEGFDPSEYSPPAEDDSPGDQTEG